MTRSADFYARATAVTPGGVHSPVRAFRRVGGTPLFIRSAQGSRIEDVDGRWYTDFCMAFGPMILGHTHPAVLDAVTAAAAGGWSYGTAEPYSLALTELICSRLPWVENLRFVNSGTEAVMSALRLARAATGRSVILKFDGCYHGHADAMLIRAGSGLAGIADSAGVPAGVAADTLVAQLDDIPGLESLFAARGAEIAAAIIEPLPANHGLLPQRQEFLDALAWQCQQHGTLLIFDEVISGFRVAFGGMAEITGIRPDLVTYGKIIGGGFPVGAYAGRREIMQLVAPVGPVYQAGTLAANPVAMAAGLATLALIEQPGFHAALERSTHALCDGLEDAARAAGVAFSTNRVCGMFGLYFSAERVETYAQAMRSDAARFKRFFHAMLERGVYFAPSAFEAGFMSAAHSGRDIADTVAAAREAFREVAAA